jgi:hypothetical protein
MAAKFGLMSALAIALVYAQSAEDPEISRTKANIERLRGQVAAGVLPRAELEQAEATLAEARETAYLRRTLYGNDLTEEQADQMTAVTQGRVERAKGRLAQAQKLVDQGVAARNSVSELRDRLDLADKEHQYAQGRARLVRELASMARAEANLHARLEEAQPAESRDESNIVVERFDGNGVFTPYDLHKVNTAFETAFSKEMPVSALGDTAVHRALGFDHRNRVDVAVDPDQPEGVWLRKYLTANSIPYFAFRAAVQGKATGPHIHIGPMSNHIVGGG